MAARDYQAVLDHDPESGSAWAALGRVRCQTDAKEASRIFARGLRRADRRAPVYTERGLCRLASAGKTERLISAACDDFLEAMKLEPHSQGPSEHYAACLRRAGRPQAAARQERARRLFFGAPPAPPSEPSLHFVDRALLAGDLEGAQTLSLELMSPGALATRAALLGRNELARTQADLVLRASPADADASVTLLALGTLLPASTDTLQGLSPTGLLLLFKLIKRTGNEKLAHQFLDESREQLMRSGDPLVSDVLGSESSP